LRAQHSLVVAFPTGFLFIYALAAGILFRRLRFWSPRFEALAHCYLMALFVVSFTLHAITRPLFYTPFVLVALTSIGVRVAVAIRTRKEHILGASAGQPSLSGVANELQPSASVNIVALCYGCSG